MEKNNESERRIFEEIRKRFKTSRTKMTCIMYVLIYKDYLV